MGGIAVKGWREGTEHRLAPDTGGSKGERGRQAERQPGWVAAKAWRSLRPLPLLNSIICAVGPCHVIDPFRTHAWTWPTCVMPCLLCWVNGVGKQNTQTLKQGGLGESSQRGMLSNTEAMITYLYPEEYLCFFGNSLEGLGDLSSSSWVSWEERNCWGGMERRESIQVTALCPDIF